MQVLRVAQDLLLEAVRRKWFLALFIGITLVLVTIGLTLRFDVVDGAIAGSRLFGAVLFDDIVMADKVLGPLNMATAYFSFYGGAFFLGVACADFGPELLAPGRIEHLLSLPVARWQLLLGTYLGVVVLAACAVAYGAGGLTVLLGVKTGLWSGRLLLGALVGWVGFSSLYSAMLLTAVLVRSASASAIAALVTLAVGILSSVRESVISLMEPGVWPVVFRWAVTPFPRLATLATVSAQLAAGQPIDPSTVLRLLVAALLFSLSLLAVAVYAFERKDF